MYKKYLRKRLFWHYCLQLFSVYKTESLLIGFARDTILISGTEWTFSQISWLKIKISKNWDMFFYRSSRPKVFCKKGVLRNFPKFTGKYRCFPMNFVKLLWTRFFTEHLWWLLLFVDERALITTTLTFSWHCACEGKDLKTHF